MVGPIRGFRVLFASLTALICLLHAASAEAGIIVEASVQSTIKFSTLNSTYTYAYQATVPTDPSNPPPAPSSNESQSVKNLVAKSDVYIPFFGDSVDEDFSYLTFQQSAELQIDTSVTGNDFSASDFLSLEIVTLLSFQLSSPVLLTGGYLSKYYDTIANQDVYLNTGYTFAVDSGITAEWSSVSTSPTPSLVAALNAANSSPYFFNEGPHTVTLTSKVQAKDFNASTSGLPSLLAKSSFDVRLEFTQTQVPEPSSCVVAGMLFGTAVLGRKWRRKVNSQRGKCLS
jgi:hypothetical protein